MAEPVRFWFFQGFPNNQFKFYIENKEEKYDPKKERLNTLNEMIETEKSYVQSLEIAVKK